MKSVPLAATAALCILLGLTAAVGAEQHPPVLTLADALARVEYHADYTAWQASLEGTEQTVQSILEKHSLGLDLGGNMSYIYNMDTENSKIRSGITLSLSKSNLWGTSLEGQISPTWISSEESVKTGWSLVLNQTLWPWPVYREEHMSLETARKTAAVLRAQEDYVLANARLKIERLYRTAQLAEARVALAEERLAEARRSFQVLKEKQVLGEANELTLISGELNVLRAERELEASAASASAAKAALFEAVALAGDYQLEPLHLQAVSHPEVDIDLAGILADVHNHPIVLPYELELAKASRELEAAAAAGKPQASFTMSLGDRSDNQQGTTFTASVTIGYPLLDRNQQENKLKTLTENVENAREAYERAVENVISLIQDAEAEVKTFERDTQIAYLTLRQAELEWEAAKLQHSAGIIDEASLNSAKLRLKQAQLDYYESAFNCAWAKRRLSLGIVGDITGTGGLGR